MKEDVGISGKISSKENTRWVEFKCVDGVPQIPKQRYNGLFSLLHRAHERQKWEAYEEQQKEEKEKREAEERESMQSMEWHEFTVVEVIDFTEEVRQWQLGLALQLKQVSNWDTPP